MTKDWLEWHIPYDQPGSWLQQRLAVVQRHIRATLHGQPAGPIRAVSVCAGQGRDLLGALADHPRRADVTGRLVELDRRNVELARAAAASAGLVDVEVVQADASFSDAYQGAVPADLVLVCGVFGNIGDRDILSTVTELPSLCARQATVIWTRFPRQPDLLPLIDRWFVDAGFELVAVETGPDGGHFGVGVHRLTVEPSRYRTGVKMFTFLDRPDPTGRCCPQKPHR